LDTNILEGCATSDFRVEVLGEWKVDIEGAFPSTLPAFSIL
jgi:hypothetical protein